MNHPELLVAPDDLLVPEAEAYGAGDSFDPPPDFEPVDEAIVPVWLDETLLFDDPDDDEERDDDMMLALLDDLGVELDTLDEPIEVARNPFYNEFGVLEESEEDEVAA